jgi:uncharacterized protein
VACEHGRMNSAPTGEVLPKLFSSLHAYEMDLSIPDFLLHIKSMVIGACEITLHLPECHSLKEKRQIIKSLMARVRHQFEVAIAEVDEHDRWQIARIGVSCVSNDSQHADKVLQHVRRYIEETRPDLLIANTEFELFHW